MNRSVFKVFVEQSQHDYEPSPVMSEAELTDIYSRKP